MKSNAIIVSNPEVLPALPKGGARPAGFQQQPQPIHITVNMPPTPVQPAPPAPPAPPVTQENASTPRSQNPVLRYWKLILGLLALLLITVAIVHFAKRDDEKSSASKVEQENAELREQLAQQRQQPQLPHAQAPVVPVAPIAPVAPAQVESYGNATPARVLHQRGGAIVSNVQEIDTPDGSKWLLLYGPNGDAVSYPVSRDRSAASIAANMTWNAPKPRVGKLEIFDSVPGQKEQMYIYAWKLR